MNAVIGYIPCCFIYGCSPSLLAFVSIVFMMTSLVYMCRHHILDDFMWTSSGIFLRFSSIYTYASFNKGDRYTGHNSGALAGVW